jgi:hypothetical protein
MQVILKWIAQFLLLPLLKELGVWIVEQAKKAREFKKLKEQNKKISEAYEKAPVETADSDFDRLP